MELHNLKLHWVRRHVRVLGADGTALDLWEDDFDRAVQTCAALVQVARELSPAPLRGLSLDLRRGVLQVLFEAPGAGNKPVPARLDGAGFDARVRPVLGATVDFGRSALGTPADRVE